MRTTYRNGDPINLHGHYCDGCEVVAIDGVNCHETGCPEAWRDNPRECFECGCEFMRETRHQRTCDDCMHPEAFLDAFEDELFDPDRE